MQISTVLGDERAKTEAEEARRKRDNELAIKRVMDDNRREVEWWMEQRAEAVKRGSCLRCLKAPGWMRVKFIKHRGACPKAE